jgi:hypothetical protein
MLKFALGMIGGAVAYQMWYKPSAAAQNGLTAEENAQLEQEAAVAEEEAEENLTIAENELMQGNLGNAYNFAMAGARAAKRAELYATKLNRPQACQKAGKALASWRATVRDAKASGKMKPKTPTQVSEAAAILASDPCKVWGYTPGAPQFETVGRPGGRKPRHVKRAKRHTEGQAQATIARWQSSDTYPGGPR